MRVEVLPDYDALSERAAAIVVATVRSTPEPVLGFATGDTPRGLYRRLAEAHGAGTVDLSRITAFDLDEYVGLPPDHPRSCRRELADALFDRVGLDPRRVNLVEGGPADAAAFCTEYERRIERAGGIDLQILGIGINGHVGFNEPGSPFGSRTRVVRLARETIARHAQRFEGLPAPDRGVTMGLGTIREARALLLMASGDHKAVAVRATLEGPVAARVPATIVRLHPAAHVLIDEAAASALSRTR